MSAAGETVARLVVRRRSDAQLVSRALYGDAVAFSELHRRFSGRVFAYCLARLMSVDAAQDATQEVFLRLLSADPDQIRSVSGWLFGVARHVCVDIVRSQQRVSTVDPSTVEGELSERDSQVSAEDEALSKSEAADIFVALRRMRPRYRTVLVMRELHGQPITEIAEALSINTGAAYTLLSRARDAFGKTYAETLELPKSCRQAVELLYRKSGSGISESEGTTLEAHLASCDQCRREARLADDRPLFAGLLPLLPTQWALQRGLLGRAMLRLGGAAPSLANAGEAAPFAGSLVPVATSVAVAAAILLGVAIPSAVGPHAQSSRSPATVAWAQTSAGGGVVEADVHSAIDESGELRAQLLEQHRLRNREQLATRAAGNPTARSAGGTAHTATASRTSLAGGQSKPSAGKGTSSGDTGSGGGSVASKAPTTPKALSPTPAGPTGAAGSAGAAAPVRGPASGDTVAGPAGASGHGPAGTGQ